MKAKQTSKLVFAIRVEDIQHEALTYLGRELSEEEILIAKDGLEWGLLTGIDVIYSTIFNEMIKK